jgi:ABC-type transporter MlaC component
MLFAVRTPGDNPASLSFLWGKDNGQWKIISYEMMSP